MLPWECYPNVLSLGAGVQSSTLALMASEGLVKPMPRFGIFADTQAEPESVYRWLDWLETKLAFPLVKVTKGSLSAESLRVRLSKNGISYHKHSPPAFTQEDGRASGFLMRQCTEDFKLSVLFRHMKKQFPDRNICQWIGISTDEAHRMKVSREPRIHNRYPLIELGMSRQDCLAWMEERGYPKPPRSACVFCPYHSDSEWIRLRDEEPEAFAQAVEYERGLQETISRIPTFRGKVFLHRSLIPLTEVEFKAGENRKQFGNECEGMCGV